MVNPTETSPKGSPTRRRGLSASFQSIVDIGKPHSRDAGSATASSTAEAPEDGDALSSFRNSVNEYKTIAASPSGKDKALDCAMNIIKTYITMGASHPLLGLSALQRKRLMDEILNKRNTPTTLFDDALVELGAAAKVAGGSSLDRFRTAVTDYRKLASKAGESEDAKQKAWQCAVEIVRESITKSGAYPVDMPDAQRKDLMLKVFNDKCVSIDMFDSVSGIIPPTSTPVAAPKPPPAQPIESTEHNDDLTAAISSITPTPAPIPTPAPAPTPKPTPTPKSTTTTPPPSNKPSPPTTPKTVPKPTPAPVVTPPPAPVPAISTETKSSFVNPTSTDSLASVLRIQKKIEQDVMKELGTTDLDKEIDSWLTGGQDDDLAVIADSMNALNDFLK